ncbi:MAG: Bug family tripartite tricarboxylate transporter substrate binding protein [Betaproteobacteria bacterium]
MKKLLLLALVLPAVAFAQAYPNRPIRLIIPFASGGGSDTVGRVIANALGPSLGQSLVVENRTGAGGAIGADAVAKAPPDGYTLLLGSTSEIVHLVNVSSKVPYDPVKDFAPISLVGSVPMALTVNAALPVSSVQDLVRLAKEQPGKLSFGSGGTGTTTHLAVELFAATAGIRMNHVPYKGSGAIIPDLLNGNLQLGMPLMPAILPQAASGKVKILAVSTAKRVAQLPHVPTLQEAGIKDYDTTLWTGMLAPAATPRDIVARLNREIVAALAKLEVKDALAKQGAEPIPSTPEQFAAGIRAELRTMDALVKQAGIKID